jgi:hypothetical protein
MKGKFSMPIIRAFAVLATAFVTSSTLAADVIPLGSVCFSRSAYDRDPATPTALDDCNQALATLSIMSTDRISITGRCRSATPNECNVPQWNIVYILDAKAFVDH